MAWETRQGLGRYYTRSFRVNGRVVRQYVGAGLVGELAAAEDQKERERRRLAREVQLRDRERLEAITQVLGTLAALSEVSIKEALERAGYHRHKGQWRKQRPSEVKAMSEEQLSEEPLNLVETLDEIGEALRQGRPGSREAFNKLAEEHPELVAGCGDVTRLAEESLLHQTHDAFILEKRRLWLAETCRRLAMPGDGELERQLIHRLALNLLAVSYAEARRAVGERAGVSLVQAEFMDRHVSRLQSDLLKASRALGQVRRLAQPTVLAQMNIAEKQQINITAALQPIEAADAE